VAQLSLPITRFRVGTGNHARWIFNIKSFPLRVYSPGVNFVGRGILLSLGPTKSRSHTNLAACVLRSLFRHVGKALSSRKLTDRPVADLVDRQSFRGLVQVHDGATARLVNRSA